MARDMKTLLLQLVTIGAAACTSVYAANSAPEVAAPDSLLPSTPYSIELIDDAGRTLESYARGGRFYVLGEIGARYSVRVSNPTPRRVEAVVSIDGLDVIDGRPADFAGKRGYIVPAYDTLVIDGFRTSDSHVAAFRFSSVAASYAGRKGKPRNVGVIGVAIFEERAQPAVILPAPPPHPYPYRHRHPEPEPYGHRGADDAESEGAPSARSEAAPPSSPGAGKRSAEAKPAEDSSAGAAPSSATRGAPGCCRPSPRPGLGTEFGEQRWSQVSFTRFERRDPRRPDARAELRYNDAAGLAALGIRLPPAYDPDDLDLRETADPFPATGYATPPR